MVLSRVDVDNMDIDHSILAIFEDSAATPEGKNSVEEENESLLSALSEMLDDVEDDDGTLSPFDTLPDKTLVSHPTPQRTPAEVSLAHRLRPRPKPPNIMMSGRREEGKGLGGKLEKKVPSQRLKKQNQTFFETKARRSEGEIELFSSTSLANLVRIMHSYCLKLHVEEGGEPGKKPTIFSQEEVWKYQRPHEESDEEINVVSDDEAPVKDAREEDEPDGKRDKVLKGVLLNGNPSRAAVCREKKRVSFGPVQVASFDESEEDEKSEVNGDKSLEGVAEAALSSETSNKTKGKSLSLQEYKQLRQQKLPLVEKQGNYATKWPSVSVPPKELTPILGLQAPTHCSSRSTTTQPNTKTPNSTFSPPGPNASTHQPHQRATLPTPEPHDVSPARPEPGVTDQPKAISHEHKRSPAKRSTLLSTDPPNPVLLPLPSPQTASPCATVSSQNKNRNRTSIETMSTLTSHGEQNHPAAESNQDPVQKPDHIPAGDLPPSPESPMECPFFPPSCSRFPCPTESRVEGTDAVRDVCQSDRPADEPSSSGTGCNKERAADSGIEAPDLTSLLEQFEETQAKERGASDEELELLDAASVSDLPADVDQYRGQPVGSGLTPSSSPRLHPSTSGIPETHEAVGGQPVGVDVPEPLSTEIILSTQQPPRRRIPPAKAIQIIDPRPLPAKKNHPSSSGSPAAPHVFFYLLSEHDYCVAAGDSAPGSSSLSDVSKSHTELQAAVRHAHHLHSEGELSSEEALQLSRCVPTADQTGHPASCAPPTPPPSPPVRGRQKRRYRRRSPRSDSSSRSSSSSSSGSRSPKRQRTHHNHSESSSCSSSPSYSRSPPRRYSFSYARANRSRSRSWSRSPSAPRSPPPYICRSRWREVCSSRESRKLRREHEIRTQKLKAIDERRVVYVGRIRRTMTHDELRERFAQFGEVECVSLHFRDRGDHYGFVTFYSMEDAFAAIDNGGKLRRPDELPFDICFGGRRQFCNSNYSDLDANRDAEPSKSRLQDVDFDSLLKQAQRGQTM